MAWGYGTTAADASAYEGRSAGMGGGPREDNIGFYLDDATMGGGPQQDALTARGQREVLMAQRQVDKNAAVNQLSGIAALGTGKHRPVPGLTVKVLPDAEDFMPGYLNKLQAQHPSWRVPSPGAPIGSWGAYGSYLEPSVHRDPRFWSGSKYAPEEIYEALNPDTGKTITVTGRRSSNVQPYTTSGGVPTGLSTGGVADQGLNAPGFPTKHSFMPDTHRGVYNNLASMQIGFNPNRMQDMIRINANTMKALRAAGFSEDEILDHEKFHLANRTLANNVGMWSNVDFLDPQTGKTSSLLDTVSKVDQKGRRVFDRELLHMAIFSYDPQFLDEPIKNRYKDHNFFKGLNTTEKMQRARALAQSLNEAALLVDNIRTNQKQHMLFWNSMTDSLLGGKSPKFSKVQ